MAVMLKHTVAPKCECCQTLPLKNRKPKMRRTVRRTEKQELRRDYR